MSYTVIMAALPSEIREELNWWIKNDSLLPYPFRAFFHEVERILIMEFDVDEERLSKLDLAKSDTHIPANYDLRINRG